MSSLQIGTTPSSTTTISSGAQGAKSADDLFRIFADKIASGNNNNESGWGYLKPLNLDIDEFLMLRGREPKVSPRKHMDAANELAFVTITRAKADVLWGMMDGAFGTKPDCKTRITLLDLYLQASRHFANQRNKQARQQSN